LKDKRTSVALSDHFLGPVSMKCQAKPATSEQQHSSLQQMNKDAGCGMLQCRGLNKKSPLRTKALEARKEQ